MTEKREDPPKYRVILNWDGDDALGQKEVPMSREDFIGLLYGDLGELPIDCLFWNGSAGSTAFYPSKVLEFKAEAEGGRCANQGQWRAIASAKAMIERGEDVNRSAIDGAQQHGVDVFFSFRMNDQHGDPTDTPRLKRDHPELLLGSQAPSWFATSYDYSHQRVREHRLEMIREVAEGYDFDGIELDWQRHALHLPVAHAFRRRYVLTDFMRQARRIIEEAGRRRGRPLYLAARVGASLESCLHVGYDVERWVEEGLMDYLIPSACAEMDSSLDGRYWVELCAGRSIRVNPSLGGFYYNATQGTGDSQAHFRSATRALAARLLDSGIDGFYLFNWYTQLVERSGLIVELVDPDALARATKTYIATARPSREEGTPFAGIDEQDRIYGEVPVELHPTSTACGPTVSWEVVDDAPAAAAAGVLMGITLRLHLQEWTPADEVVVRYDWSGTGGRYRALSGAGAEQPRRGGTCGLDGVRAAGGGGFPRHPLRRDRARRAQSGNRRPPHPAGPRPGNRLPRLAPQPLGNALTIIRRPRSFHAGWVVVLVAADLARPSVVAKTGECKWGNSTNARSSSTSSCGARSASSTRYR